jgi:hypothetical protein
MHALIDFLFYYLFSSNIILCMKECEERERESERRKVRERNKIKKLFAV